jgi:hypothetical protein
MVRIGKCKCGGEFRIVSYSREEPAATAICNKCMKEVRCVMIGKDNLYRRDKTAIEAT